MAGGSEVAGGRRARGEAGEVAGAARHGGGGWWWRSGVVAAAAARAGGCGSEEREVAAQRGRRRLGPRGPSLDLAGRGGGGGGCATWQRGSTRRNETHQRTEPSCMKKGKQTHAHPPTHDPTTPAPCTNTTPNTRAARPGQHNPPPSPGLHRAPPSPGLHRAPPRPPQRAAPPQPPSTSPRAALSTRPPPRVAPTTTTNHAASAPPSPPGQHRAPCRPSHHSAPSHLHRLFRPGSGVDPPSASAAALDLGSPFAARYRWRAASPDARASYSGDPLLPRAPTRQPPQPLPTPTPELPLGGGLLHLHAGDREEIHLDAGEVHFGEKTTTTPVLHSTRCQNRRPQCVDRRTTRVQGDMRLYRRRHAIPTTGPCSMATPSVFPISTCSLVTGCVKNISSLRAVLSADERRRAFFAHCFASTYNALFVFV
ncbi:extensin-like [Triticum urartu]|uniref:extensin-like n=1 Tax=Triticum urartu TaxID=4572 RepID=UPI0020436D4F|nr:extensin-like [Triticum urartu]